MQGKIGCCLNIREDLTIIAQVRVKLGSVKVKSSCARYEGVRGNEGIAAQLLISALSGSEWSASRLGRFLPRGQNPLYALARRLTKCSET